MTFGIIIIIIINMSKLTGSVRSFYCLHKFKIIKISEI